MASHPPDGDGIAHGPDSHVTSSPKNFHHPYTPYAIQETFMSTVYQVLEEGKVGILESPTGTVSLLIVMSRD
jgi:hypothetical protein